jgi:hypothetical protein
LIAPLIPIILLIGLIVIKIDDINKAIKKKQKENEIKSILGLGADEDYLCFSRMGGVVIIKCGDCGYQEKITCFTHGFYSCNTGRQCPNCHAFLVECEEYHKFGDAEGDFVCSKCGAVVRKKDGHIIASLANVEVHGSFDYYC